MLAVLMRLCVVHYLQDSEGGAEAPQAPANTGKPSKKTAGKTGAKAGVGAGVGAAASKADKAAEQQRQAELELLMMDDSALQDVAQIGECKAAARRGVACSQACHAVLVV